jgi:Mg-chelatase subunit ChlI
VEVTALTDEVERVEVMKRREAFLADPAGVSASYRESQEGLRQAIQRAVALLPSIVVSERLYSAIAQLTLKSEVPSHRADITILKCAKAMAGLEGRNEVEATDVLDAAMLALGHRLPRDPFAAYSPLDATAIRRQLEDILEAPVKKKVAAKMASLLS